MRFFLFLFGFLPGILFSQEVIHLKNPSFEDIPRAGGQPFFKMDIKGWWDCGTYFFRGQTPPDIHPTDGFAWSVDSRPQDGKTYLGMVVRFDDTQESLGQALEKPLEAGKCYSFSVYLSMSAVYLSPTWRNRDVEENFTTPSVLRIWGGNSFCDKAELLGQSAPVDNVNWKPNYFKFSPKFDHRYIIFEAFYETPVLLPYNGHILVDNCSSITEIECDKTVEDIADEMQLQETERVEPVVVAEPEKKQEEPKEEVAVEKKAPVKKEQPAIADAPKEAPKPKILAELDENRMSKGQKIRIPNLYFEADSSQIKKQESFEVLNELAEFLNYHPNVIVEIGGHTASFVTPEYGLKLSSARAEAVARYLKLKGVPEEQVTSKGYGNQHPIVRDDKHSRRLQQKNQRVEIKVLSMDGEKDG